MTKQELQDLKQKPLAELEKMLGESRERLRGLKLDLFAGKVKNESVLRELKKDIARIETMRSLSSIQHKS